MAFSTSLMAWLMHIVVLVLLLILKRLKCYSSALRQILLHLFSTSKTAPSPKCISLYVYLGTFLNNKLDLSSDIQRRVRLASSAFGRLSQQVFLNRNLNLKTKLTVNNAVCVSTVLYGCEVWVLYRPHVKTLEQIHVSWIHRMLRLGQSSPRRDLSPCPLPFDGGHHCWAPAQMDGACHPNAGKPTAAACAIWWIKRPKICWRTVQTF